MAFVLLGSHTGFNLFTLIAVDILSSSFMNPKSLCSTHDCVSIFIYTNCCLKETFFEISMEVISVSTFLKCFFYCSCHFSRNNKETHQVFQTAPHQEQQRWKRAGRTKVQGFQPEINLNEGFEIFKQFYWYRPVTCGRACMTVSSKARIPLAILRSLRTLAILRTLITLMMVGLMGKTWPWTSSSAMPIIDRKTIDTSSWFHLNL